MSYLAIFKRVVPFLLTFSVALLIASIFIPIAAPNFSRGQRGGKWREHERIRTENSDLRIENERLRQENEMLRQNRQSWDTTNLKWVIPDVDVDAPPPPPAPKRPRHPHDR